MDPNAFPEDIFTEPADVDPDTLANLGPLRRLAGMVQLIDYASVYLGIASGIDPLAIAAIKDLRDLTGRE